MNAPPENEKAPACRQGALSVEQMYGLYPETKGESIRLAAAALSAAEFNEWITNLLFRIHCVPSGAEDLTSLCGEYRGKVS